MSLNEAVFIARYLNLKMLCGGVSPAVEVTQEDRVLINNHVQQLNTLLNANNTGYKVIGISKQVVAGTNHFFHLEGESDHHIYTATVFEPLPGSGEQSRVLEVSHGHNDHKHGHGTH